ncbi:MAG: glycosyltransferase [Candidatus Syntrophosphaera sp.]|nr:glycosyltransferase [Candidatus Syntrophosphaera sp.]
MKKLLHLQLLPLLTGVQNFSLHLLSGLPEGEFEIWVASQPGGEFVDAARSRGYKYLPVRSLRHPISLLDIVAFLELLWLMQRHRFDIVHTNSSKPGLLGRLAATICRVPVIIYTAHGTAFQEGQSRLRQRFYQALEKLGNRFCHRVVFVNNSDREKCLALGLLPAAKAITINNALPPDQAAKLDKIAAERKFSPDKADFVVGSTLRFSEQKNVVSLVSAACQACRLQPRLRIILVGEGEHLPLCRQIVRSHGLNERILFPGWDPDVSKWLALFDCFVLYSRWEAQPFSIIEAMHSGLPVIGSRIPSILELVDESCGWTVPLDDPAALVKCLKDAADDPNKVFGKGRAALERVRNICDHGSMVSAYLELYRSTPDQSEETS